MIPKEAEKSFISCLGRANYRTSMEDRITYAYDASGQKCTPAAVVFPESVDHVSRVLAICNTHDIPIVPRGAGTGLTGGAVPLSGGIVMVMKHFNRIITIDKDNFLAVVEPGVITSHLQKAVEKDGLFYPPDPASMAISTIGGNIAENAGGMRAVKYGVTENYVMGLEVVLPNGEIIHTGSKCIKDVVGYDITRLFVGSEGTLGVVTQAILRLLPQPESRQTVSAVFHDIKSAAKTVPDILRKGITPTTLELLDKYCLDAVSDLMGDPVPPGTNAMLLMDVDGPVSEIAVNIERIRQICLANKAIEVIIAADAKNQDKLWRSRRTLHGALNKLKSDWEEEDISVPISRIPDIIDAFEEIGKTYAVTIVSFGHAGDGNIHVSLAPKNDSVLKENVQEARNAILKKTIELEGRIAAEHGIGLIKREKIAWNIDQGTLNFMRSLKQLVDPKGLLNPGKIFPSQISCSIEQSQ